MDTAERAEETQRREAEPSYRGEAFAPRWLAHDEAPPPLRPSLREMARAMTETRGELRRRRASAAQHASGRGSGEPLQRHEAQAAVVVQHGHVEETLRRRPVRQQESARLEAYNPQEHVIGESHSEMERSCLVQ